MKSEPAKTEPAKTEVKPIGRVNTSIFEQNIQENKAQPVKPAHGKIGDSWQKKDPEDEKPKAQPAPQKLAAPSWIKEEPQ